MKRLCQGSQRGCPAAQRTLPHTDAPAHNTQGDEVSPSARKPKRGAGSSTAQSAETIRSEPSPPLPDLRSRSPALFQNCGGIIERFTGHDKNALSKALLRIAGRLLMHMDDRVQLAFKMDQYKPRTSVPEACLTQHREHTRQPSFWPENRPFSL